MQKQEFETIINGQTALFNHLSKELYKREDYEVAVNLKGVEKYLIEIQKILNGRIKSKNDSSATVQQLNDRLGEIYQEYYGSLLTNKELLLGVNPNVSSPLLMNVFEDYLSSQKKILIVGQETHTWCGVLGSHDMNNLLNDYKEFELGQKVYLDEDISRVLASPFWNFSRRFFVNANFDENYRTKENRMKKGFLWTNISKIDVGGNTPSNDINSLNTDGFKLLRKEVEILNPDVVLFMTGDKYYEEIKEHLNLKFVSIFATEDNSTAIRHQKNNDDIFPKHTYQINHPRYLYSSGNHNVILDKLVELINKI